MKTPLLGLLIALATVTALAQGTVNFANIQASLNVPVYLSDGTTKLSGAGYMAELIAGTSPDSLNISVATTGFLTGAGAGYFAGGAKTITSIAGGVAAWFLVRFWNTANGSTFAAAYASGAENAWGQSTMFSVVLGDPGASPPTVPAALSGLAGQRLTMVQSIPEPSALALLGCGLVAALLRKGLTPR